MFDRDQDEDNLDVQVAMHLRPRHISEEQMRKFENDVSAILTASVVRPMPLAALLWCGYSIRCNGGNVRSAPILVQEIRVDSAVRHPPVV